MDVSIAMILLDVGSRLPFGPVWGSLIGFIAIMTAVTVGIGLSSRNLSIGALGGYLMFSHLASNAEDQFLSNLQLVTLVLIIIAFSFKMYRSEVTGQ